MEPYSKAIALENDFGIQHPRTRMFAGLRRKDDRDIEPLLVSVARDRIAELATRGFDEEEAMLVILMRGGRLEVLALAVKEAASELRKTLRARLKGLDQSPLIAESQRGLDLWRRA
jgi:hypothetical protein